MFLSHDKAVLIPWDQYSSEGKKKLLIIIPKIYLRCFSLCMHVCLPICVYVYICLDPRESLQTELSKALLLSLLFLTSNVHRPHAVDTSKPEMLDNFCSVLSTTVQKRVRKVRGKCTVTHWGQWVEERVKKDTISRSQISINSTSVSYHATTLQGDHRWALSHHFACCKRE